jgi:hypothetical protein
MTSDKDILSLMADRIVQHMGEPDFDLEEAIAAGDVVVGRSSDDFKPGFSKILDHTDGDESCFILISARLSYRFLASQGELAHMASFGPNVSFSELLSAVRDQRSTITMVDGKVAFMEPTEVFGHQTVIRPYLGQSIRVAKDISTHFHYMVLHHTLKSSITDELDMVIDIGSGIGDVIAELAASDSRPSIEYVGCEFSKKNLKCHQLFAAAMGKSNLRAIEFDVVNPDFRFLEGKRVFLYSVFSLVYANPFPANFWSALSAASEVRGIFFEPVSYRLPHLTKEPLFEEARARHYGLSEGFFSSLQSAVDAGQIAIEEIVPDYVGLSIFSAVSMIRFKKLH